MAILYATLVNTFVLGPDHFAYIIRIPILTGALIRQNHINNVINAIFLIKKNKTINHNNNSKIN